MFLKRGDDRVQGGYFDQPVDVYLVTQGKDAAGGETRVPRPDDLGDATPAFRMFCNIQNAPGIGRIDDMDADRIINETLVIIATRYAKSRLPTLVEGTLCQVVLTGDVFEIRSVDPVNYSRKKIELTCRKIV